MKNNATKDEVAIELAKIHYELEDGITHIFRLTAPAEAEANPVEPIKLLEVNTDTPPTGVMPLYFGPVPSHGISYPTVIVEVTPEEFEHIKAKKLPLPNGWVIGEPLPKPAN